MSTADTRQPATQGRPRWRRIEIASLVLTGVVVFILVSMFAPIAGIEWFLVTTGALVAVGMASIVVGIVVLAGSRRRGRGILIGIVAIALPIVLWVGLGSLTVYGLSRL